MKLPESSAEPCTLESLWDREQLRGQHRATVAQVYLPNCKDFKYTIFRLLSLNKAYKLNFRLTGTENQNEISTVSAS